MDVVWHPIKSEADLPPRGGIYWVTTQADDENGRFSYAVELAQMMRHVVKGVGDIARKALGESDG